MTAYEFEGKTTEEAIEKASQELDVPVEDLVVEIIEPGSAGIFGLVGIKKTKIRVMIKNDEDSTVEQGDIEGFELAKESLEDILSLIPVETKVKAEQLNGRISLTIEGDAAGILIGRKGKTLDAIQYIINKIVHKKIDKKIRIVVDSENYRSRRTESLINLAHKLGDKAKRINKAITTNPLNPHDRRIVHIALKKDNMLDTRSRGDGLLKKVVIIPKR
ncbi:MAG: protein jag [Deltaproteobacteria bacterium]|nr:protein jag [Deltaproteobacteria bacterium]